MNGRYYWLGVGSAFAIGVITGVAGVRLEVEKKLRSEYEEREALMQGAYEKALEMGLAEKETPASVTDILIEAAERQISNIEILLDENLDEAIEGLEFKPEEGLLTEGGDIQEAGSNPYHQAVLSTEVPDGYYQLSEPDGSVSNEGISYIDPEDYLDEDGRFKGKIDIMFDDGAPLFIMDGAPIEDWEQRIGSTILVDFFQFCPPGTEPVLYVRNQRTDEDYEVVRVEP